MVPALYDRAPAWTRFHVNVRWRLFPFPALLPYAPATGLAVDLGCGHGLLPFFLATERPALRLLGSDPDGQKIGLAQQVAQRHHIHNVEFVTALAQDTEYPECDWISLVDVLYLVPYETQEALLRRAVARLRPGGRLMIKEMAERPRWKVAWGQAQEILAVRVLHLSHGHSFYFRSEADWLALLTSLGLRTSVLPLDAGYLHPHVLFIGENAS
ncbi:MAG TPA: class I SAM-dependent methyltransferase [Pseudomonadota bacterium]|nr:class I SAM-dependent methyltransferase [Pseudomonadota bacterium]